MTLNRIDGRGYSYLEALYQFLFIDRRARRMSSAIGLLLTFACCLYFGPVLGWPDDQIVIGALVVCGAWTGLHSVWYWLIFLHSAPTTTQCPKHAFWKIKPDWQWVALGYFAIAFLLIGSALPLGALEPKVAEWRLQKTDIGLIPNMEQDLQGIPLGLRFSRSANAIDEVMSKAPPTTETSADQEQLSAVREKIESTLQTIRFSPMVASAAQQEIAYLQGYEDFSRITSNPDRGIWQPNGEPVSGPIKLLQHAQPFIVRGSGEDRTVLRVNKGSNPNSAPLLLAGDSLFMADLTVRADPEMPPMNSQVVEKEADVDVTLYRMAIEGYTQNLDGMTWLDVTFRNSVIKYDGNPTYLAGVRFSNCKFQFGTNAESRRLQKQLATNRDQAVNFASPK